MCDFNYEIRESLVETGMECYYNNNNGLRKMKFRKWEEGARCRSQWWVLRWRQGRGVILLVFFYLVCFAWFGRSYNGVRVLLSATVDFTFFCLPGLPVTGC